MKAKITIRQWALIICCAICWGSVLNTGWLFTSYYSLVQDALGMNDAAMGACVSAIGLAGVIGYAFGFLPDMWGSKICMHLGILCTIGGSLFLLLNFSADMALLSCWMMVAGGTVFYCTSTLRLIGQCTVKEAQGTAMGSFYALMGLFSLIVGTVLSRIIAANSAAVGLRVLLIYSIVSMLVMEIAVHFLDPNPLILKKGSGAESSFKLKMIGDVLSSARFWVLMVICFITVSVSTLMTYTQPLLATQFGVSTATVTLISTFCNQGTILLFSTLTGVITDKLGSATKMFLVALTGLLVACGIVLATPWTPALVALVVVAMVLIKTGDAVGKPGRQLLVGDCGFSEAARGTAVGIISIVMALPGLVFGNLFGSILTKYEGTRTGYQYIYMIFAGMAVIGLVAVLVFQKMVQKAKAAEAAK